MTQEQLDALPLIAGSIVVGVGLGFFLRKVLRKRGFYKRFEQPPAVQLSPEQARRRGRAIARISLLLGSLTAAGAAYLATGDWMYVWGAMAAYVFLTVAFFFLIRAKSRA